MPFGQAFRPAGAPATTMTPPTHGAPPPPAGVPAPPAAPPTPPPAAVEPKWWVSVNGAAPVLLPQSQAVQHPGAMVMPENQAGGWVPAAQAFPAQAAGGFRQVAPPAAGSAPRGAFAGVENAEVYQRNPMLKAGNYVARLTSAEYKNLRQGGSAVIVEMQVVVSSYDPQDPNTHQSNKEGTAASVFIKQNDSFASNMKEIILALSGFDQAGNPRPVDDVVSQAECEALVGAEQVYAGRYVYLEARDIMTRQNKPFTRINWHPCPLKADGTPDLERLAQGA